MRKIPVIVGPTSSGKTSLSLELCKKHCAEIISADSRQIYKFMDIGTGKIPVSSNLKITKNEGVWNLNGVAVHGYDLTTPDQFFSGYEFAKYALDLLQQDKKFVIVGGTGFYIDLITGRRKLDGAAPDFEIRADLEKEDLETLLEKLEQLDPESFEKIDKSNRVRVLRAVEKCFSQNEAPALPELSDVEFVFFGLDADREYLYNKVDKWLDEIWQNGLVEETRFLLKKFPENAKLSGIVYKSVVSFLSGETSVEEAVQRAKFDLHAYIRRQLTWFRKNSNIKWLNIAELSVENCIIEIEALWTKTS